MVLIYMFLNYIGTYIYILYNSREFFEYTVVYFHRIEGNKIYFRAVQQQQQQYILYII